jgi:hypothetical protein
MGGSWSSASSSFMIQDTTPPIADAGDDKDVITSTTVTFDGSGSHDNSGVISNYTWVISKDGSVITTIFGVSPSYTFDTAGNYTVVLEVWDPSGNTGSDSILVVVKDQVKPPDGEEPEEPGNDPQEDGDDILPWLMLIIILIAVIIMILFLLFWWRSRKKDVHKAESGEELSVIQHPENQK